MTNRELFHATMRRENGDTLLHFECGFMAPYEDWLKQGLPPRIRNVGWASITPEPNLFDHFGIAGYAVFWFDQGCIPAFEHRVLAEKDGIRTETNASGVTLQWVIDGGGKPHGSPPHEIDFTIKSLSDYEANRHRFVGNMEKRSDPAWIRNEAPAIRAQQDHPVTLWVNGPFAFLRDFLGTENAMVLPYTDPELIRLMLRDHLETSMAAATPLIRATQPDMCCVWEDCCGRSGPFIAPGIFEEMMAPWYRAWKDYLLSMGVPWIILDTDGNPGGLARHWYEAGVDCLQPWEVNSSDMLAFAAEFPQYVVMGGIYKHIFEPGDPAQVGRFKSTDVHEAIDAELERVVKPMRQRGGYFACLDHWVFWGVKYDDFRYYCRRLREKYGAANRITRFGAVAAE